jgi:hypothetical protein
LLIILAQVTEQIKLMEHDLVQRSKKDYPATQRLQQIAGVGPLTALCFVLKIGDPVRFGRSHDVGRMAATILIAGCGKKSPSSSATPPPAQADAVSSSSPISQPGVVGRRKINLRAQDVFQFPVIMKPGPVVRRDGLDPVAVSPQQGNGEDGSKCGTDPRHSRQKFLKAHLAACSQCMGCSPHIQTEAVS